MKRFARYPPEERNWRTAIIMAVVIAVLVGVVGTVIVLLVTDASFGDAVSTVVPGMVIGAAASLLMVLLGSRHGGLEARFERAWQERLQQERLQQERLDDQADPD